MKLCLEIILALLAGLLVFLSPALPCSLCGGDIKQRLTLRQEAQSDNAKLILYGTPSNPRLTSAGGGATDLKIEAVVRPHAALGDRKVVEIPRYLPANDPKDPPKYLIFCDVFNGKLDMYRGVPVKSAAV